MDAEKELRQAYWRNGFQIGVVVGAVVALVATLTTK